MEKLMNKDVFRKALEDAIKGKSANQAPFSKAWASGKLDKKHFARWAENHYHYVGPFADYLGYVYSNMPEEYTDAKDFLLRNKIEVETYMISDCDHHIPIKSSSIALNYLKKNFSI